MLTLPDRDVFRAEVAAGGGVQVQRRTAGSAFEADHVAAGLHNEHPAVSAAFHPEDNPCASTQASPHLHGFLPAPHHTEECEACQASVARIAYLKHSECLIGICERYTYVWSPAQTQSNLERGLCSEATAQTVCVPVADARARAYAQVWTSAGRSGCVGTWTISHGSSSPPSDDLPRTAGGPLYARDGGGCCGDWKASAGGDVASAWCARAAGLLSVLLPVVCGPIDDAVLNTNGSSYE